MKKIVLCLATLVLFAAPAFADIWVKGHYDKDGNWVPGYWKTEPNGTTEDNYSTFGNYNPHKPPPNFNPPTPYPRYKDYGTNPFPGGSGGNSGSNTITIPKLNAPVAGLHDKNCPERTSIYQPACP